MRPPGSGKAWRKPKADFVLTKPQRRQVLEWFQTLMFPDGYAANLRRGVNLTTMRINGLKSHDYHIWIERLLPVMVRGDLPDQICSLAGEGRRATDERWKKSRGDLRYGGAYALMLAKGK